MNRKNWILFTFIMLVFGSCFNVYDIQASENKDIAWEEEEESTTVEIGSEDELLYGFMQKTMTGEEAASYGFSVGDRLTGVNKNIYDKAKTHLASVANGVETSTQVNIYPSDLSITKECWSASDLGVEAIVVNNSITQESIDSLRVQLGYDIQQVINALATDCAYELYWFGGEYIYNTMFGIEARYKNGEWKLYLTEPMSIAFSVSENYAGESEYTTDKDAIGSVNKAIDNAEEIVNVASTVNNISKLYYYMEQICEYTDYNYDVLEEDYAGGYGDPWQIVYVFDGDDETNVVCEGYSKAFKFLCDMTDFGEENIYAYCATGVMLDPNGDGGNHMWNIVHMDDGNQYLVDVTNCDDNGFGDWLFLLNASGGNVQEGYVYDWAEDYAYEYIYSEETFDAYDASDLEIATTEYLVEESSIETPLDLDVTYIEDISCGKEIEFVLSGKGGSGEYKYYLNSVLLMDDKDSSNVIDPTKVAGYSENNKFSFTFFASGTYQLRFYVMDLGATPIKTYRKNITITIDDENYPDIDSIVEKVCEECVAAGNTTDYDKALWLHDWLLNNCVYDTSYLYCGAEGALARGLGTCESYYLAYKKMLDYFGIPNGRITGNGHVWNAVMLDGEWYQIDCTWDDNGYSDLDDYESHLYFGVNDEIMSMVHSDHSSVSGYESNSLENNYFIRSGKIRDWSDNYVDIIQEKLSEGEAPFDIVIESSMPDSYIDVIYSLVAYELSGYDWDGENVKVKYVAEDKTLRVSAYVFSGFEWAEDGKNCKIIFADAEDSSKTEAYSCEISGVVTEPATCCTKGVTTYTASYGDYTDTKEVRDVEFDRDNHEGETEIRNAVEPTYDDYGYTGDTCCLGCDGVVTSGEKVEKLLREGWHSQSNIWYYYVKGVKSVGWKYIDNIWYFFNADGSMVVGWRYINGDWYYFNKTGSMATGWGYIGNKWYYFSDNGDMITGWKYISNKWYYFNTDGDMVTGWKYVDNVWYYFNKDGDMVTGWKYIDSDWYYFDASGAMQKNRWIDGIYYVKYDGTMAVSEWVVGGKYHVDQNGRWDKTR